MRVLSVQPFLKSPSVLPEASASARTSTRLIEELLRRGCEVEVFPSPEPIGTEFRWAVAPGLAARVWPSLELPVAGDLRLLFSALPRLRPGPRSPRQMYFAWMELIALRRALALGAPDLVHDHLGSIRLTAMMHALGSRVPVVLTHPEFALEGDLTKFAAVVFPSRMALERSGEKARRARVLPPPVAPSFVDGGGAARVDRNSMLFVCGPRSGASLEAVIEAFRSNGALRRECVLTVCGGAPQVDALRAASERERLPVKFTGVVNAGDLRDLLDRTALIVLTGQPTWGSRALREAACRGVAAVTWSDQARDLNAALEMPAAVGIGQREVDPRQLALTLLEGVAGEKVSPAFRAQLSRRAREVFSPASYAERHLQLYAEVAGMPREATRR
jgi:glycosyltransferase involved in cell wall biosynthesis